MIFVIVFFWVISKYPRVCFVGGRVGIHVGITLRCFDALVKSIAVGGVRVKLGWHISVGQTLHSTRERGWMAHTPGAHRPPPTIVVRPDGAERAGIRDGKTIDFGLPRLASDRHCVARRPSRPSTPLRHSPHCSASYTVACLRPCWRFHEGLTSPPLPHHRMPVYAHVHVG